MNIFQPRHSLAIMIIFCSLFLARDVYANSQFETSSKIVFLTFDADMTRYMQKEQKLGLVKEWYDPALIEYLQNSNIPATFFVTGLFAQMYPSLIQQIAVNQNFSIQNHSYDHPAFEPNCFNLPYINSDQKKESEISQTQDIIKSLTGQTPTYFRYPGLCHNAHDDALVAAEGLSLAQGEISSGDAYMKKPKSIVNNVLRSLSRGHVIVFHLGTKNAPETLPAVKLLIPKLKKLGYTFSHL